MSGAKNARITHAVDSWPIPLMNNIGLGPVPSASMVIIISLTAACSLGYMVTASEHASSCQMHF